MNVSRTLRVISVCYLKNLRLRQKCCFSSSSSLGRLQQLRLTSPNASRLLHLTSHKWADYPSHIKVSLPALSPTMEQGTIISWQKKEGDQLSEGDLLCEIETDKATIGFETPEEGYLAKIVIREGVPNVPIGKLVCIIVQNKEDIAAFKDFAPPESDEKQAASSAPPASAAAASPPPAEPMAKVAPPVSPQPAVPDKGRLRASPLAKNLAARRGVDLKSLTGSGPSGRILAADVGGAPAVAADVSAPPSPVVSDNYRDIPLSNMRATIAKRLSEAKSSIPHYYLTSELHIDELLKIRKNMNTLLEKEAKAKNEKPQKLSINDFIIKASALACLRVPEANSSFMGTFIRENRNVDVSVAVSTPKGLLTPIIFNAHTKGISTIAYEVATLAAKAREGKLQPYEFQGGTFSVSNLGMFGSVDHFTAIINPPQSCILAIGASRRVLVPDDDDDDEHQAVTALQVTLSCDHRVVDGAVGAVWLQHFKRFMEEPITMLLSGTPGMDEEAKRE